MATLVQKAKKTKKQRKHGRGKRGVQNLQYKGERRHVKAHIKRIERHIARYGKRKTEQKDNPKRKRSLQANGDQKAIQALAYYRGKL